jgi:hypothetical protein
MYGTLLATLWSLRARKRQCRITNYRIFRYITRTPNFFDIPFDV